MQRIPLFKSLLDQNDFKVLNKSLKTGWLTHGPNNLIFEKNFSKFIGTKYAVSMNSCTSALECALKVIKKKGEVIIPSWTWVSTANAVLNTGNKPVFADVDINSRNLNADFIKKKITKKTIAIIVVHYSGLPCEMEKIISLTKKHKIELIEDSAETLGATWKKKQAGSFGVGCFSFFPTKNITTTEGGMLTFQDKNLYEKAKKIIAHGIDKSLKKNFWHRESVLAGHNYRLPNHLAALGYSQLKKLNLFNKKRNKIAKIYDKELKQFNNFFIVQTIPKYCTHSYQMYTTRMPRKYRSKFLHFMRNYKIEVSAHFDPPLHQQKYLKNFYKKKLPKTDILSKEIVTLPIYPDMKREEVYYVIKIIKKFISKLNS
mgnify:CR=1 FL=1